MENGKDYSGDYRFTRVYGRRWTLVDGGSANNFDPAINWYSS